MDVSAASWLVIVIALVAANLPFFNEQLFGLIPIRRGGAATSAKPLALRLLELVVLYLLVGAIAYGLESHIGNTFPQTWQFYWINGMLFLVLAFPGFVVRYLRKQRH